MLQQFYPVPQHDFRYELNKDMNFAAAHAIPHKDAGACAEIHGHTYFVNITVAGDRLNHLGFLTNFQALKKIVHGRYDHSIMNNHEEFAFDGYELEAGSSAPSTEVVAEKIWQRVQQHLNNEGIGANCLQVLVRETPTSYVIYRPRPEDFHEEVEDLFL